jgi:hypothetical protein
MGAEKRRPGWTGYRGREMKRERDGKRMAFWFSVRSHLLASNHPHPLSVGITELGKR